MTDIIKKIIGFRNELNNFYLFATMYISDQGILENLKLMYDSITESSDPFEALSNLYKILDIICLVISEKEGSSEDISNTYVIRTTKIGEIYKQLDALSNEWYKYTKSRVTSQPDMEKEFRSKSSPGELLEPLGISGDLFDNVDPTLMMPTENYVTEPPAGAKVVVIDIKNTQNLIANIRNIVDAEYVKSKFPNMTTKSGVNEEMIRRYDVIKIYKKLKEEEPETIEQKDRVFQKLSENSYRELVHYPESDYVRNREYAPLNNYITNFENKRILLRKQSEVAKSTTADNALPGNIKHLFINEKKRLDDAIFLSIYKPEMSDDDVLRLGLFSATIKDHVPKNNEIVRTKFDSFINRKTLEKIF